jgi:hypothetical protein
MTPGGKKLWASSPSFRPQYGVNGLGKLTVHLIVERYACETHDGLMMMAFPVIIAGAIFPQARTIYEFWR